MKEILCLIIIILMNTNFLWAVYEDQPKLLTRDGNLILEAAEGKNITFRTRSLMVNDIDLLYTLQGVRNASFMNRGDGVNYRELIDDVSQLRGLIYNRGGIVSRLQVLENNTIPRLPPWMPGRGPPGNVEMNRIKRRVRVLETKVNRMLRKLGENNCRTNPCQNGGTCVDMYDSYVCHCPKNWQGQTCGVDVNECAEFAGSDLGCQNGATCINTQGGYSCSCAPGFVGTHCLKRTVDCETSGTEMCGHGICVHANDQYGYKCICEQGWKTNGLTPPCTVDVNECLDEKPHCSKDPEVSCINLPGSFMCGQCPAGFTGNGYYCADIDECSINNGGCSVAPFVRCTNLRGSSRCSRCPTGFIGDGRTCTPSSSPSTGLCADNLCHPLATCSEYQNSVVNCICPPGYTGSGFGPRGCTPSNDTSRCPAGFCQNGGTCYIQGTSYACHCPPGTNPPNCLRPVDMCAVNPCLNGGTCANRGDSYYCSCPRGFSGQNCQTPGRRCGGMLRRESGTLKYPEGNEPYQHNSRCAWLIQTNASLVLNVTFKSFDLERPLRAECKFDWLQIHDGRSSSSYMIGRFCGDKLPKGGNIISSRNTLYLWFRADNSTAHDGFELSWESIEPSCGGDIETNTHGVINSPGSPGHYPMNRDCYWRIYAPQGKRIQLNFHTLQIEAHPSCSYDYLAIYDGNTIDSPLLEKFCNTSSPEPLLTPKNEVLLHFHSDDDNTDVGFQISYNIQPGVPGCGGLFTGTDGVLSSPVTYEDKNYPNNLECDYLIRQPKNMKILLTVLEFHLEESTDCKFDYLEIYDGKSENDPLIGRFCALSIPKTIRSQSNEILLRFKTDWSTSHGGFNIKYKSICGGSFSEPTGIITSPYYPNDYPGIAECRYEISAPLGNAIELDFEDIDIEQNSECAYDFIQIFDGHSSNDSSIGKYCGSTKPSRIISTYNYLTIAFETDRTIHGRGFKANYTFIELKCGGIVKTNGSIITPPMQESTYEHDAFCRWLIVAPEGNNIQLNWVTFDLETHDNCEFDYVEIFDNSTQKNTPLGRYCKTIPPSMSTVGNVATVVFKSDSSTASSGFSLRVEFMDVRDNCGGNFFSKSGYIRSPGWPQPYPNSRTCEWFLQVPVHNQIQLIFRNFTVEDSTDCKFDRLLIRNGATRTSPILGTFCGETMPPLLKSFGNQMYLQFVTDGSKTESGFEIEWTSTLTGCGGTLTSYKGSITSPQYPEPYTANALCSWRIVGSHGSQIRLVFTDFELEVDPNCIYDSLEVFDGKDASARSLGKYCDSSRYPLDLTTSTNYAFLRFVSDRSNQNRGFNINYMTKCNTVLTGWNGIIESPNFPEEYPHRIDCEWTVQTLKGNKIYVEFTDLELERSYGWAAESADGGCTFDYVEITQYKKNDTVKTDRYCNERPAAFTTVGNQVMIKFKSDVSGAGKGFRLEWSSEGCGGILTKPYGNFSTPNYPQAYPHDMECLWDIEVEYGKTIELTINDLDIEHSNDCRYDGVRITTGGDLELHLAKLCHLDEKQRKIIGNGNKMRVRFFSDSSMSYKGFSASYETLSSTCGGSFTASSGDIYSPNYPKNYGPNEMCEWKITVDPSHNIDIFLKDFDLEPENDCSSDTLYIFDGDKEDAERILLKACGNSMPNKSKITTTSNTALIMFKSNSENEFKGFNLNYTTSCGSHIRTNESGLIHLSDITRLGNYDCTWTIEADDLSKHVTFTVTHISSIFGRPEEIDCFYFLKVFDGTSLNGPERAKVCEMTTPPTIVSNGNALTVHLGVNQTFSESLIGLDIVAHYSVLDNACGGTLTSFSGQFASPSWPLSYPLNIECVWTLKASPGNTIGLTIRELEIADSDNCNNDYLEIRENNADGKLLGVYCGSKPLTNHTDINTYWIKFKSGEDSTAKGFLAEYSYSRQNELSGPTGIITTPLFPRQFLGDEQMTYRVTVDMGSVVLINFEQLRFGSQLNEMCIASIRIYDGYDETAIPLIEQLCGFEIPEPVTSTTNVIYIIVQLHSFDSHRGNKFKINYRAVNPTKATTDKLIDGCGGDITIANKSQFINVTSPGYANGGYASQLNCTWFLYSTNPAYHPAFYFVEVDLEDTTDCSGDYIRIATSKDLVVWNEGDRMCNANYRGTVMYRAIEGTPHLKINFRSDYSNNRTGFAGVAFLKCGGELRGPTGEISMMNTTEITMNNMCLYNITVRPGKTIKFEFDAFNMPQFQDTCASYISFKNGQDDTAPLLGQGKYCGTEIPSIPETSSRYAFVKFFANRPNIYFKLRYTEVGIECGGVIQLTNELNSSIFSSPNFPNVPNPHSECVWNVMAPSGEAISLSFTNRFDLTRSQDCRQEYVEIREGGTERSLMIDRFCGNKMPNPVTTKSNRLRVKFFTDVTDPKNGFQAEVKIATCGGTYQSMNGVISSEGFGSPGAYPANMECVYRIVGPPGTTIQLSFKQIHLPDPNDNTNCTEVDHISIYSVIPSDTDATNQMQEDLIGQYCGERVPATIQGASNEILLKFKTGVGNTIYKGFQLNYNISHDRCRHDVNAESGTITSPGYPLRLGVSRFCEWRITVPKGRRVTANILDLDLSTTAGPYSQRLIFYHDFTTRIRIKTLTGADSLQTITSSDNKMLITAWIRIPTNNRGFKIDFHSNERTLCEGSLNEPAGIIYSPTNVTSFICEYSRDIPINSTTTGTLILELKDVKAGLRSMPDCRFLTSKIFVQRKNAPKESDSYFAKLCGNDITDTTIYTPFHDTIISARQSLYGGLTNFTLYYRTLNCGGIFNRGSPMIQQPMFTNVPSSNVACAYYLSQRSGVTMHIRVEKMKMTLTCDKEYIQIYNGPTPMSPHLVRYCGTELPSEPLNTQSENLYMYYYSETYNPNTEFRIDIVPTAAACGGVIHMPINTIQSPGNGSYFNNMECVWELRADPGYTIDLWFKDRFYIEDTVNCVKDYVEVSKQTGDETWESLGKFCGRHMPPVFNTTSSRMKIKIHTDATNTGDGFTFEWKQKCGGIFAVTDDVRTMISPKYPQNYDPNLKCNYTFVAPTNSHYINMVFKDFQLEETSRRCIYDNLTIYRFKEYAFDDDLYEKMATYCRQDSPGLVRVKGKAVVLFQSDQFHEKTGFLFEYHLDKCGSDINTTTELESPQQGENGELPSGLNCIWKITAPVGKNIIIRFEKIELEHSDTCWFDYISVYRGHNMSDGYRAAKLCGDFTDRSIDLANEKGIIQLKTDTSNNKGSFRAKVIITTACSDKIDLRQANPIYNLQITQQNYEPNMDCHYLVKTDLGSIIKGKFNRFHIPTCNHNATDPCSCNFVEVRDGGGPFAELIGKFCGHEVPRGFQSSSNMLWVRFATSSSNTSSSGFDLELSRVSSICGSPVVNITKNETYVIEPPRIGGNYDKNLQCTWSIHTTAGSSFEIIVEGIDIEDSDESGSCSHDYLKITDDAVKDYIHDKTFEDDILFKGQASQSKDVSFYMGLYRPMAPHIFCGQYDENHKIIYFTTSNSVHVKFVSNNEREQRGFKLTLLPAGDCHDYEGMQGRITVSQVKDCTYYIRAPQNHTISVYFNSIYFYDDNCTKAGMKIFDGTSALTPSITACSFTQPNPFFSTSNIVKIAINAQNEYSGNYDISYVATNQGRGCGGTLINYGGVFTSPMYPENNREETDCRWTMHVPRNMKVALRFTIFDMGSKTTCNGNFIQIIEKNTNGEEEVKRQYCGEDEPAIYRSETSVVTVRLKTTRNFAGTGFIANYMGAFEDSKVQNW